MWMQSVPHWEAVGCSSRLLCSKLHQNMQTHTLAGKSLKLTTGIHLMSTQKLIHFHSRNAQIIQWIVNECLEFPSQWNWYHVFSEWQLSRTPQTMEYHETFRNDIHICKSSQWQNTTPFIHGTEDLKSEWLKTFPQTDMGT
jgi:hypothetical protein